ncbi:MAG: stage V sporulation protein S [Thermoanaerobacteraceae bacterium]|nr:stage V sporulation protein S [Thermoanaerobacteraceae bacterium]
MELLKVSNNSQPKSVAGAIAALIRQHGQAELQAIGAGAVNQAVKSIAVARGYLASNGVDLVMVPAFHELEIDGAVRTAIRFKVFKR